MTKYGQAIFQPVVKEQSPRGKINVADLYNNFSSLATQLHANTTNKQLKLRNVGHSYSGHETNTIEFGVVKNRKQRNKVRNSM